MFLGGGTLIEIVEARVKPLERILKDYTSKRFTGYVTYRNDVQGTYISIALINGGVAGCRAIDKGVIYEGAECSDIAMRYLYHGDGVIEVYDLPKATVVYDMMIFPFSRIERKTALIARLGAEVSAPIGLGKPIPSEIEVTKPVSITQETIQETVPSFPASPKMEEVSEVLVTESEPKVSETKPTEIVPETPPPPQPVQETVISTKETKLSISNECIDPVTLYRIMRSSQLLESLRENLVIQGIIQKIENIIREKNPSYIYVSGNIDEMSLRIVYDSQLKSLSLELEKGGNILCGEVALKEVGSNIISNIKIWTIA